MGSQSGRRRARQASTREVGHGGRAAQHRRLTNRKCSACSSAGFEKNHNEHTGIASERRHLSRVHLAVDPFCASVTDRHCRPGNPNLGGSPPLTRLWTTERNTQSFERRSVSALDGHPEVLRGSLGPQCDRQTCYSAEQRCSADTTEGLWITFSEQTIFYTRKERSPIPNVPLKRCV